MTRDEVVSTKKYVHWFGRYLVTQKDVTDVYDTGMLNGKHSAQSSLSKLKRELFEARRMFKVMTGMQMSEALKRYPLEPEKTEVGNAETDEEGKADDTAAVEGGVQEEAHQGQRQDDQSTLFTAGQVPVSDDRDDDRAGSSSPLREGHLQEDEVVSAEPVDAELHTP